MQRRRRGRQRVLPQDARRGHHRQRALALDAGVHALDHASAADAAGDGAFGGSTIVMAMQHGQRAAYYVRAALEKIESPIPYRTPYRTRRVPVAQDLKWEQFALEEPVFHGVGEEPESFPEIEDTYDEAAAMREAARCYRCDAETGSTDYSVHHREDLFSMARTHPKDVEENLKHAYSR